MWRVLRSPKVEGLPNLTSGLVGNVGWDAIRHWEPTLPANAPDETEQPELTLALATDIAVVDHKTGSVWLIANAVNVPIGTASTPSTEIPIKYRRNVPMPQVTSITAEKPSARRTAWIKEF